MSETAWVLHEGLAEDRYSSEPGPARPAERGLQDPKLKPFGAFFGRPKTPREVPGGLGEVPGGIPGAS